MEMDYKQFKNLIPIQSLDTEQQNMLLSQTTIEIFRKGSEVFKRGDADSDSLYLLSGTIELQSADGHIETIEADTPVARHPLAGLKPRRYTGTVVSSSATIARISTDLLDRVLSMIRMPQGPEEGLEVQDFGQVHSAEDSEWMMSMLQSPAFLRLPAANIQVLFERLQEIPVKQDQVILDQGEPGDFYYLLKQGSAQVIRINGNTEIQLATLSPPQSFGEEALLSEEPRNSRVRMLTDGVLMRLSKQDFQDLLREPLLNWVDLKQASELVRLGAVRLDVRTEQEFQASSLSSALNIPLFLLRLKLRQLDRSRKYILFCDNGSRSASAAFLLSQEGFDISVLKGGLSAALA